MPIRRFNWNNWDVVTNIDGNEEGDINRTDYTYECSSLIPGVSSSPSGNLIVLPGLSGCQLLMPPRISDFNMVPSALIEFYIFGNTIN